MDAQKLKDEERGRLFVFASVSLVVLTLGFFYLEIYDPYDMPNFVRVLLALYWVYAAAAIYVAKFKSDKLVAKMCCNIFRSAK